MKNQGEKGKMTENINELGAVMPSGNDGILILTVIGQIEGHYILNDTQKTTKYEHLLPLLADAEKNPAVHGVLIIINTVGGDVEAGMAIAEMLAGMKKNTVSYTVGGGHSIGLPIAVSCKRSFIAPTATMTLHPVRINGTVLGVPQAFSSLERMQDRVNGFIVSHSDISHDTLEALLSNTREIPTDVGSIIDGNRAVELGIIDSVGGIADALSALKS